MKASAFVVGAGDGPGAALKELARQVGFESVQSFGELAAAERQAATTPLIYFLFASVEDLKRLKTVASAIRASTVPRIKFSPMIYFCESPSIEEIRTCINMGFDDVITLPFTLSRIGERLGRQVDKTLVYYETATYFGPDRRREETGEVKHSGRGTGGQYRRMEIVRSVTAGVSVLSDETHVVI